jgi:hypothetical protein
MAYTQADLDAVKKAIAGSQLEVQYGDKRVRFRSLEELERAKRMIAAELASASGVRRTNIVRLRHGGKGI